MVDVSLIKYIKDNLDKGFSIEEIEQALLKRGYSQNQVDSAIDQSTASSDQSSETPFSNDKENDVSLNNLDDNSSFGSMVANDVVSDNLNDDQNSSKKSKSMFDFNIFKSKNSDNNKTNQNGYIAPLGFSYNKESRPSREELHSSVKSLSVRLDSHNKVFVIGSVILFLLVLIMLAAIIYLYTELKISYNSNTPNQEKTNVCGYCEYYRAGVCERFSCCANYDCDDNNPETFDRCASSGTIDSRCENINKSSLFPDDYVSNNSNFESDDEMPDSNVVDKIVGENDTKPKIEFDSTESQSDNISISPKTGSNCASSIECDDGDVSTKDLCAGSPNGVCINFPITDCLPFDNYCPSQCNTGNDPDCSVN